jgi:lysophospholipase L1-like esterase
MLRNIAFFVLLFCAPLANSAETNELLNPAKRILFLGDSITHAGHYITLLETHVRAATPAATPVMINLGLPSETCSGLSEPDHPFPRPDVHERLDRALAKVKPDIVFACYGMNDGIYYPFSEERFAAYQDGVGRLIKKVKATGAKLVLMTPPAFDPLPLKQKGKLLPEGADKYAWFSIYEGYDDVLRRYSQWIMQQGDRVDLVIDLHTPVNAYVAEKRKADADFTMSPDGVHVNNEGHQVLAEAIASALRIEELKADLAVLQLVSQRQKLLHDAWLSHVGHKRPGVKAGLPVGEAGAKAAEIDKRIDALAGPLGGVLRMPLRIQSAKTSFVEALLELEQSVAAADPKAKGFGIHILGIDLQLEGITKNQRITGLKREDATVADILTALVVAANPDRRATGPDDPRQKLVWVVGPHPQQPDTAAILITTRKGAQGKFTLPTVFQPK